MKLKLKDILIYYDQPLLMTVGNKRTMFLCICIPETEYDGLAYDHLCVKITEEDLQETRTGAKALLDAFKSPVIKEWYGGNWIKDGIIELDLIAENINQIHLSNLPGPGPITF